MVKEMESTCKQQSMDHAKDIVALQREQNMERYRGQELLAQLQVSLTCQHHMGGPQLIYKGGTQAFGMGLGWQIVTLLLSDQA